jgi:hypothetical protein
VTVKRFTFSDYRRFIMECHPRAVFKSSLEMLNSIVTLKGRLPGECCCSAKELSKIASLSINDGTDFLREWRTAIYLLNYQQTVSLLARASQDGVGSKKIDKVSDWLVKHYQLKHKTASTS